MPAVWNLGNTTIRNPNRIQQGLKLFADRFQGQVHGAVAEHQFATALVDEEIVDSQGTYSDLLGRKWRSAFVKLGFATEPKYKKLPDGEKLSSSELARRLPSLELSGVEYELTPAGKALINADTTAAVQDVFLRQLVCHEIPSPIESKFEGGGLKPFILLLQVLQRLREQAAPGLSRLEIGLFLQVFRDHKPTLADDIVGNVLKYRVARDKLKGRTARLGYDYERLKEVGHQCRVKPESLVDYADTTMRYSQMSGLLSMRGDRLELRENRITVVAALLVNEPRFVSANDPLAYLERFYLGIELPFDSRSFAIREIRSLASELTKRGIAVDSDVEQIGSERDVRALQNLRFRLIEQLGWTKEEQFASDQAGADAISNILELLEAMESARKAAAKGMVDRATYLEWLVWRGFLALDHFVVPVHQTRRFPLDEDMKPRHPAPSGGPDMIFDFRDYRLVVEVTLTTSSRQEAAEGEPVRRHVFNAKRQSSKPVYCLFIAPEIDRNAAQTFKEGKWLDEDDQVTVVDIVPMSIELFSKTIGALRQRQYTPDDYQKLLLRCLEGRSKPSRAWLGHVEAETQHWLDKLGPPA